MANVRLTEAMEEYVSAQISAGTYSSVSDAVNAGLRLLMEQDGAQASAKPSVGSSAPRTGP